ncbi:ejaculatory bulb-specific protein 3-like [Schistocerca americana]|uniref:ejaculatory bulb-specific protein 3-like n=1 Tax=Schistocerca americana TaxID=7009 RepID=UPI001F4F7C8C|nr:ejaculatory bulb-specific protein 3-like [Schistocerca americana]
MPLCRRSAAAVAALLAVAACMVTVTSAAPQRCSSIAANDKKYTTRYDSIDIDSILKSDRLLRSYMDCLMDRGPCTQEGCLLKAAIPDALQTECSKCSAVQKKQAGRVMAWILENKRNYWDELIAKYDPEGNFRKKYGYDEDDDEEEK